MEDREERVRLRFDWMLASAEGAADEAAQERAAGLQLSSSMVSAIKYMNRAGGFLEAISIVLPDLGAELIDEFETFAEKIDRLQTVQADADRRATPSRHPTSDRRGWDRRLGRDRRRHSLDVTADQRRGPDRRTEADRRTGKLRELADRRLRALHP
jgi:hypothetical protein